MNCCKKKTRREFLGEAGGAAAAAAGSAVLGSLMSGCSDSVLDPNAVVASIDGPSELQIPKLGMGVQCAFDSAGCSGPITSRVWSTHKEDYGFGENDDELGDEVTATHDFTRPGTHVVKLEVSGDNTGDAVEHNVLVHPPDMPEADYPLISFLRLKRNPENPNEWEDFDLMLMQGDDTSVVTRLVTTDFSPIRMSWEPGGRSLGFTRKLSGHGSVFTYDFLTDEVKRVTPASSGEQFNLSWGPNDWIAYIDNSRTQGLEYRNAELVRVRPDGSERTYFSGADPQMEFQCFYPSWDPTGERIALGGHLGHVAGKDFAVNRVGICEDWEGGSPVIRNLNTEEKIRSMMEALVPPEDVDLNTEYFAEGVLGTAWSPDGEWIAYVSSFGPDWMNQILCLSRVDGTEHTHVIAEGSWPTATAVRDPCWSPDGSKILYTRHEFSISGPDRSYIQKITLDGSVASTNISHDKDTPFSTRDEAVAWYRV